MNEKTSFDRRAFLGAAAAVGAAAVIPRSALGGAKHVPPSEKIHIGYVGCGSQGLRQLIPALEHPAVRIAAVCDPNRKSDDYPEWSRHELNEKVRAFLGQPSWAADARGGLCGREVALEMVNRHYSRRGRGGDCPAYADFREMLDKQKDLDAVYIMTPDHLHGVIAIRAMRQGKHVVTHKPISNVFDEMRIARDMARQTGLASQLFCMADVPSTPMLSAWLASGVIGAVREVHNWSTRPFWPQGMTEYPAEKPPVPEGLDWDLWLGPAPQRAYHPAFAPVVFRGWCDFGAGALGDMGHYSFRQIFEILKLGSPVSVEARRSQAWRIENFTWQRQTSLVAYPQASMIRWEFPARADLPPLTLHWYDGGLRPPMPTELESDGEGMPGEGMLLIGERGRILADFFGGQPRLIPKSRMRDFRPPATTWSPPVNELEQFVRACRSETPAAASFPSAYAFSETILLGNIALRVDKKLRWDAAKMEFTNSPEANRLRSRTNRPGWEV